MQKLRDYWGNIQPLGRAQYFGRGTVIGVAAALVGFLSHHNHTVITIFGFAVLPFSLTFIKGRARDIEMGQGRPTWAFPAMLVLVCLMLPLDFYLALNNPPDIKIILYWGTPLLLAMMIVGAYLIFKKGKKAMDALADNERQHREDEARLGQSLKGQSV